MTISIHSKQFKIQATLTALISAAAAVVSILAFVYWGPGNLPYTSVINISSDIFCMLLGLVLFICCAVDSSWDPANLNAYLLLIFVCFLSAFFDEFAWLVDGRSDLRIFNYLTNTAYFMCTPTLAYLFWKYVITFLNIPKERTFKWTYGFSAGMILTTLSIFGNLIWKYYFTISPEGVYHREELYSIPLIFAYYMLVITLLLVILARKRFKKYQIVALFSYALVPMLVGLLSVFKYGLSLSSASIMMVFMLMYCVLNVVQSRQREVAENELKLATAIQETILPRKFPPYPDRKEFEIHASMDPAKEVGGDFYDFFMIDDDHLAMVIADVSGKGIPASLFMMVSKTLIKTQTLANSSSTPSEILGRVNAQLCENNVLEMFVTVWIGILTISTGDLVYANAGHEYPALRHEGEEFALLKEKHSPPLGVMDGIRFREGAMKLRKGDILYVYTDGVPEAADNSQELLGTDRMIEILSKVKTDDPMEIDRIVREKIDVFTNGAAQFDDITMLCLRYEGPNTTGLNVEGLYESVPTAEEPKANISATEKELVVDAKVANLPQVQRFIEEHLEKAEFPKKTMTQISVAVEEIFVNIANYAYAPDAGKATVRLAVGPDPKCAVITFIDQGKPYDPLSREDPDVTLSAEDREVGGLGIFITKKTMDEVSYRYEDGSNIFTMKKKV